MHKRESQALILAAGRGSRLGIHTQNRPKCLAKLAGHTLLEWELDALRAAGIFRIGLVRGYLGGRITFPGLHFFENPDWRASNMVASLCCAQEWLGEAECVISYGDIVYHPDTVSALLNSSTEICVAYDRLWRHLWEARFSDPLLDAESFRVTGDILTDIGKKRISLTDIDGQYMGLFKITPNGWQSIKDCLAAVDSGSLRRMEMTDLFQLLIDAGIKINAVPVFGRWCEVDSESDLITYERKIKHQRWSHDWRF